MNEMRMTKAYYFSVEGDTEKHYLDWLQIQINNSEESICKVKINSKVEKDPKSYVKAITILEKTNIVHLMDCESNDVCHVNGFRKILDDMRSAERMGKSVAYTLGYSNFTFELWIILHKTPNPKDIIHRDKYIADINKLYNKKYKDLDEYKHKANFESILTMLSLYDVVIAIENAKNLMNAKDIRIDNLEEYKKFKYYKVPPSLSIWESIQKILQDCGLLPR